MSPRSVRALCAITSQRCGRIKFPVPTGVVGWLVTLCVAMLTMWPAQIGAVLSRNRAARCVYSGMATLCLIASWERARGCGLIAAPCARTRVRWGMLRMGIVINVLISLLANYRSHYAVCVMQCAKGLVRSWGNPRSFKCA